MQVNHQIQVGCGANVTVENRRDASHNNVTALCLVERLKDWVEDRHPPGFLKETNRSSF